MFLCTDELIQCIASHPEKVMAEMVTRVEGEEIRVFQVSDLHRQAKKSPHDQDNAVRTFIKSVHSEVDGWNLQFNNTEEAATIHGMVVSGDLIDAEAIVNRVEREQSGTYLDYADASHLFVTRCLTDTVRSFNLIPVNSLMVVPGNHDVFRREGTLDSNEPSKLKTYVAHPYREFDNSRGWLRGAGCESQEFVSDRNIVNSPRLLLYGDEDGVLAVLGIDSNHACYDYNGLYDFGLVTSIQLESMDHIVSALRAALENVPLYVWVVMHHHLLPVERFDDVRLRIRTIEERSSGKVHVHSIMHSVTLDGRDIIERLQKARVSVITHGHMHQSVVQKVAYLDIGSRQSGQPLHVIACPSFVRGNDASANHPPPYTGSLMLVVNKYRGIIKVDITAHKSDKSESFAESVVLPLLSTTRCSPGERRIYRQLRSWLGAEPRSPDGTRFLVPSSADREIRERFAEQVETTWRNSGYVQLCGIPANTLGNLEEIEFPLAPTASDLPKKRYRLLVILHDDGEATRLLLNNHIPIRDSSYGTWDAPLLPAFRNISDLLHRIRADLERMVEDIIIQPAANSREGKRRLDGLRRALETLDLETSKQVDRELIDLARREFVKFSPTDGRPELYEYTLSVLERFALHRENKDSLALALANLEKADPLHAYRWEPGYDERRAQAGYVWFPVEQWRSCPAIVSRNADVMMWIEREIGKIKENNDGGWPSWLLCGKAPTRTLQEYGVEKFEAIPFSTDEGVPPEDTEDVHYPTSLVAGIKAVELDRHFSRSDERPYKDSRVTRVYLKKNERSDGRHQIAVCDADSDAEIGVLLPVQRYVLRTGLIRARKLQELALSMGYDLTQLGSQENGYLVMRTVGPNPISVLPPIIEPTWEGDLDDPNRNEYIVCDGNHRVVEYLWNAEQDAKLYCALVNSPSVPYYAYPSSSLDWHITANNVLDNPPDLYGKYSPRRPVSDSSEVEADPYAYRRYYRDFSSSFVSLGSQGGRL